MTLSFSWISFSTAVDLCSYSIVVPILPFRLSSLGYADDRLSSLVSYTLLSYSLGLVVATPPIAYFSARVTGRKNPLILGLLVLIASQLMFMFVEPFWALVSLFLLASENRADRRVDVLQCVARVIQGGASAVVWVLALVLVCESVPEEIIGQQLGIAMAGTSIGLACGPPVGSLWPLSPAETRFDSRPSLTFVLFPPLYSSEESSTSGSDGTLPSSFLSS